MDLVSSWSREAISWSSYLDPLQLSGRHNLSARPRRGWSAIKTSGYRMMKRKEMRSERNGMARGGRRIRRYSVRIVVCARRRESLILDRIWAASRKVVEFINVIYEEAIPSPWAAVLRSLPSRSPSSPTFPVYSSCIESIEFCFTYPSKEKRVHRRVFMHSCVRAYTLHRCVTWHSLLLFLPTCPTRSAQSVVRFKAFSDSNT